MKIMYQDIALNARENATFNANLNHQFANIMDLKRFDLDVKKFGTLEENYYLLDGTFSNFPDNPEIYQWGYFGTELSLQDGSLPNPVKMIITLANGYYTSIGINILFDEYGETYASEVNIKWYRDNATISEKNFSPDSSEYFCENNIELYNKLEITFAKMNRPNVYLKVTGGQFGKIRTFSKNEITSVDIDLSISPISEELSINTLNFEFENKKDIPFNFQKRQPMQVYNNNDLLGTFYILNNKRKSLKQYSVTAEDAIGILDSSDFMGGIINDTAGNLIGKILKNESFEYTIEESLKKIIVNGYLPIMSKRDALAQVAFSIGAIVDTSYTDKVNVYLPKNNIKSIDKSQVFYGGDIETREALTEVQITEHNYSKSTEIMEIYNSEMDVGNHFFKFSEPLYGLETTNCTIVESGDNYVIINVAIKGIVNIKGKKYKHDKRIISKKNDILPLYSPQNIIKVENVQLINSSNSSDILDRVYNAYISRETITQDLILKELKVGDKVTTDTEFLEKKVGRIISLEINGEGTLTAKAVIKVG